MEELSLSEPRAELLLQLLEKEREQLEKADQEWGESLARKKDELKQATDNQAYRHLASWQYEKYTHLREEGQLQPTPSFGSVVISLGEVAGELESEETPEEPGGGEEGE